MNNPVMENLLNLALLATPEERIRSGNLEVGYDRQEKIWEVIVKYSGSLAFLKREGIQDRASEWIRDHTGTGIRAWTPGPGTGNRIYRKTKEAVFLCKSGKSSLLYSGGPECPL